MRVRDSHTGKRLMVAFSDKDGNVLALDERSKRIVSITDDYWENGGWRYRDEDGCMQMLPLEYFDDSPPRLT